MQGNLPFNVLALSVTEASRLTADGKVYFVISVVAMKTGVTSSTVARGWPVPVVDGVT